jgi:hypothetical protein
MPSLHGSGSEANRIGSASGLFSALPGRYRLDVVCRNAYLVSASIGNADLIANPWITVSPGATPAPIEIVARNGGGGIAGELKLDQEPAHGTMHVLAVSRVSTRDPELTPAFDQPRRFSFDSLAPGDYTLYAFSTDQIEFRNPEFLRGLTGGESVRVEDGATATVTIARLAQ